MGISLSPPVTIETLYYGHEKLKQKTEGISILVCSLSSLTVNGHVRLTLIPEGISILLSQVIGDPQRAVRLIQNLRVFLY